MISATMLIAACGAGDEGSTTVPTDQVSSTEPGSTTIATSSTAPVAAPVATTVPITAANVSDLALVEEYADYVWLDFTPDDRLIAMQGDKLALLDRASGELEVLVDEVVDQIYVTAISPNGRYILYVTDDDDDASGAASVMGGFSRVWDVEAGEPTVDMQPAIAGAVFLPNSTDLIVAGTHLYWMDLSTGEAVDHGFEERSTPQVIELMPDGATLVTSSGGRLVFDSIETGDEIKVWNFEKEVDGTIFGATVTGVSVSQDGTLVAVGIMSRVLPELNAIHIIDYATDEALQVIPYQLEGQNPALRQVALSPDGSLLVAAFQEDLLRGGHLEAFDVAGGASISIIPVDGAVQRVAFSPDGKLLAVGTTKRSGLKLYGAME
jgi:WD40 repeat protein